MSNEGDQELLFEKKNLHSSAFEQDASKGYNDNKDVLEWWRPLHSIRIN